MLSRTKQSYNFSPGDQKYVEEVLEHEHHDRTMVLTLNLAGGAKAEAAASLSAGGIRSG